MGAGPAADAQEQGRQGEVDQDCGNQEKDIQRRMFPAVDPVVKQWQPGFGQPTGRQRNQQENSTMTGRWLIQVDKQLHQGVPLLVSVEAGPGEEAYPTKGTPEATFPFIKPSYLANPCR